MDIYIRIKELREEKKLSQKAVSAVIKIDSSQYSKIELGKLQPTLTQIMAISSFFDVPVDWLCFGKGSMNKSNDNTQNKQLQRDNTTQASIIKDKDRIIDGLEFRVATLNATIKRLEDYGSSVQRGTMEFLNEPPLERSSGK